MSELVPLPLLYFVDATRSYSEDLVKRSGGRIFDVYLFDANLHVHCCSITPSYEMQYVDSVSAKFPDDEQDRDNLNEDLRGANLCTDPYSYYDVTGWLRANTKEESEYPEVWDGSTPFLLRVYRKETDKIVAGDWKTLLDDHDDDRRAAHRAFMEVTREDIDGNSRY